jgi:Tol biopolymer transport system component
LGTTGVDLMVVDVATRRVVHLTRTPGVPEFDPAWSPDGREIVWVGQDDIVVRDLVAQRTRTLVGGGERLVGFLPGTPDWSPDGAHLAYSTVAQNGEGAIVVMRADGSRRRPIITSPTHHLTRPSWSPDGSRIAYDVSGSAEGASRRPGWLFIARADGSRPHALIRDGSQPDWQPR